MPVYSLLLRERVRERGRTRQPAQPNFITARVFATVWTLTFPEQPKAPARDALYPKVQAKCVGYYDNPPLNPAWKLLVPATTFDTTLPTPTIITPSRTPLTNTGSGLNPVIIQPGRKGITGAFVPGVAPQQIFNTQYSIHGFTVLAEQANAAAIYFGYGPTVTIGNGFKLIPGAAYTFDLDDASDVWFIAANATDKLYFDITT